MAAIALARPAAGARHLVAGGFVATLAFAVTMLVGVPAGHADTSVERAARAFTDDRLYVDPAAESPLTRADRSGLRALLFRARTPIFLAVLPRSAAGANGNLDELPLAVYQAAGEQPGTYAVLVGDYFAAGSSEIGTRAGELARLSAVSNEDVLGAVTQFVHAVESEAEPEPPMFYDKDGGGGAPQDPVGIDEPFPGDFEPMPGFGDDPASGSWVFGLVVIVAIVGVAAQILTRMSRSGGRGGTATGLGSAGSRRRRIWPRTTAAGGFVSTPDSSGTGTGFGGGGGTIGGGSSTSGSTGDSSGGSSSSSFGGGGGTIGG